MQTSLLNLKQIHSITTNRISHTFKRNTSPIQILKTIPIQKTIIIKKTIMKRKKKNTINKLKTIENKRIKKILIKKFK